MVIAVQGRGANSLGIGGRGVQGGNGYSVDYFGVNGYGFDKDLALYLPLHSLPTSPMVSSDIYRYICTATGGVWGQDGWTMDGDDFIKNTTANWRSGDSLGSISAWFKTSSATLQVLFASCDEAGTTEQFGMFVSAGGNLEVIQATGGIVTATVDGNSAVADGAWHFGTLVSNGTAYSMWVDNIAQSLTVVVGANNGNWLADTANRDNFSIGARIRSTTISYMNGTIGEVLYHSRVLTLAEHNRLRLATNWRYS